MFGVGFWRRQVLFGPLQDQIKLCLFRFAQEDEVFFKGLKGPQTSHLCTIDVRNQRPKGGLLDLRKGSRRPYSAETGLERLYLCLETFVLPHETQNLPRQLLGRRRLLNQGRNQSRWCCFCLPSHDSVDDLACRVSAAGIQARQSDQEVVYAIDWIRWLDVAFGAIDTRAPVVKGPVRGQSVANGFATCRGSLWQSQKVGQSRTDCYGLFAFGS